MPFVMRFQPLSSTSLPIKIPRITPSTTFPIISYAILPGKVFQKPVRFPTSRAANQKVTGITILIRIVAAGTKTETTTTCNASRIVAAVVFKKATITVPITAPVVPIFFGSYMIRMTPLSFVRSIATTQLGMIRCVTFCVNASTPTKEAHALERKPEPNEK